MSDASAPIVRAVRAELDQHPYRTLAVAAAVGLVLGTRRGASLLLPLAARVATALASTAIAPLLRDLEERRAP
jgi:hypothetical protein